MAGTALDRAGNRGILTMARQLYRCACCHGRIYPGETYLRGASERKSHVECPTDPAESVLRGCQGD